uniref:DDE Tnp4 domain-containing protein n=1 Tax=Amphimedon queenslandica TaxID=400682 RepID=A0A1X7TMB6_AMPQE
MVNQNAATLPYTLVGDDIFPLKTWLMKPYPGKSLTLHKRIYNYRLSRARRTIENTFGILAAKWRIFRRPIRASPENVERIIKACVCLHNYLRLMDNASYTPSGFVDKEGENGEIIPGDWRNTLASSGSTGLQSLSNVSGNRYCFDAVQTRDNFAIYFNSVDGQVPWQVNHVTQDSRTL